MRLTTFKAPKIAQAKEHFLVTGQLGSAQVSVITAKCVCGSRRPNLPFHLADRLASAVAHTKVVALDLSSRATNVHAICTMGQVKPGRKIVANAERNSLNVVRRSKLPVTHVDAMSATILLAL